MRKTRPSIYLVAQTRVNRNEMLSYLAAVGGESWWRNAPDNDGDLLSEFSGRLCYRSWAPGLNTNVTKIRTDTEAYLGNIIEQEHGSILEHTQVSFVFHNVSRIFTHELVRHRVGIAISQESGRYVRMEEVPMWIPPDMIVLEAEIIELVDHVEKFYANAVQKLGLDQPRVSFDYKKRMTSALRRFVPFGHSSGVVWSANLRTLRYVLGKRTELAAEEEMRLVYDMVGRRITDEYPTLFADFKRQENGVWISPHPKA